MRVGIDKRYKDSCEKIVKEANKILKKKSILPKDNYQKILSSQNISVEKKKKQLVKILHNRILHSFSIDIQKNKKGFGSIKKQVVVIREIIHKIKSINNYLEESFLTEMGLVKKSLIIKAIKSKQPEKYLLRVRGLSKSYLDKIEHIVYTLMREIVFFDQKLLKNYAIRKIIIIKKEKIEITDLEKILKIQTELLDALEAKIPPASKVTSKLFKKVNFNKWIPLVFALLTHFEAEYQKEQLLFLGLRKDRKLRKKIESKIKYIINEKENILKIKEKRVLSMESFGKIDDNHRKVFHEYVSAAGL
tara:strand:- start:2403 stop:3314 length:912 start_codon:yes stop_codon:yes gene_type:complete